MLIINPSLKIPTNEYCITQIRAQGSGEQNVNKVSSAVQLRFDIHRSSLPESVKMRLLKLHDSRLSKEGVVIIKAQNHRTFERNKEEALQRLTELIRKVIKTPKKRKPTRPGKNARQKRIDQKIKRSKLKQLRKKLY